MKRTKWMIGLSSYQLAAPVIAAFALQSDPLNNAITAHGGAAVQSVATIRIVGQSTAGGTTQPVTISADLGADAAIRLDYTGAASRSMVRSSSAGVFQIVQRKKSVLPRHVGLFAEWDML